MIPETRRDVLTDQFEYNVGAYTLKNMNRAAMPQVVIKMRHFLKIFTFFIKIVIFFLINCLLEGVERS